MIDKHRHNTVTIPEALTTLFDLCVMCDVLYYWGTSRVLVQYNCAIGELLHFCTPVYNKCKSVKYKYRTYY